MIKRVDILRKEFLFGLLIVILYVLLRVPNLTLQPIFADEAIYIRWAQIMRAEPTLRFLPLSDGKTPLFMWAMIPLFKIFNDPLFAGRFLSILSGLLTLTGSFFLGWKYFNTRVGLWSGFLIATVPFMVFFDRMALVDSMLAAFSIWSLNLALLLIKYTRVDLAMVLGYLLGGAILVKPPGFFNLLALPTTLLIFDWKKNDRPKRFLKLFFVWIIALIVTLAIYNILRLGPGFSSINSRNQDYVFSPAEIKGRILDPFIPHFKDIIDWLPKLISPPVVLFIILGTFFAVIKKNKFSVVLLAWTLVPLVIQMFFLKTFTARYILFSIPPLLVLSGWAISLITQRFPKFLIVAIAAAVLFFCLPSNYYLLFSPEKMTLPRSERSGYLEEWTAGYGLKDIATFLIQKAQNGVVVVGTEGSFGTLPNGLEIYLDRHSHTADVSHQIIIIGGKATVSAQLRDAARKNLTYFIANKSRFFSTDRLELISEYPKALRPDKSHDSILFYRVFP